MTKRRKTSDGRIVTQPELRIVDGSLSPDTVFTVSGVTPWGSTSKYEVVLNGPNSHYTYKASQLETDDNGDEVRSWITKTGNDPQRLARYRSYVKEGEQANDYTSLLGDFLRSIGLKKKDGGWLTKFQNGGQTSQSTSPEQDVMNTIDAAIGEIQTKRPGQAVQKLAAMMQDPNYSMIIDMIKQEYPQIEGVLNTVEQMIGSFKCGGKTKKKVKKGAKGCVPCKKLMKVGGKLVNVWSDCEGIISKHQAGGWLIPKGEDGLEAKYKVSSAYRTNKTGTGITGQQHYFIGVDGNLYNQQVNDAGLWDQGTLVTSGFDDENFKNWSNSLGADSSFWATGFNQDKNTFDTEANARAAMGDAYDTGVITGQTVHGVTATGNKYIGDTPDNLKVTANQYVQHHGGWQNAMQAENDIFKAKRRASRQLRREQIKNINRGGSYDPDGAGSEPALTGSAARQAVRDSRRKYMDNAKTTRVANQAAILNTQTPKLNTVTPVSMSGTGSTTTNLPENTTLAKQGGWLTKFN